MGEGMLVIGNITTETYRDDRYVKSCANCGSLIYDGEEMTTIDLISDATQTVEAILHECHRCFGRIETNWTHEPKSEKEVKGIGIFHVGETVYPEYYTNNPSNWFTILGFLDNKAVCRDNSNQIITTITLEDLRLVTDNDKVRYNAQQ